MVSHAPLGLGAAQHCCLPVVVEAHPRLLLSDGHGGQGLVVHGVLAAVVPPPVPERQQTDSGVETLTLLSTLTFGADWADAGITTQLLLLVQAPEFLPQLQELGTIL